MYLKKNKTACNLELGVGGAAIGRSGKAFLKQWHWAETQRKTAMQGLGRRTFPAESTKMQRPSGKEHWVFEEQHEGQPDRVSKSGSGMGWEQKPRQVPCIIFWAQWEAFKGFEQESNRIWSLWLSGGRRGCGGPGKRHCNSLGEQWRRPRPVWRWWEVVGSADVFWRWGLRTCWLLWTDWLCRPPSQFIFWRPNPQCEWSEEVAPSGGD